MTGKAPRAWQRMLSGRRLDLLDPSPLDIEIEDIAHGLARVARWNGQTVGDHIFSVAQHSLLVEGITAHLQQDLTAASKLTALLHDAAEYVLGDLISPFKAVIGESYKAVEARLTSAIYLRFGLPAEPSASLKRVIKRADRIAAYHEATRLAGFAREEALKFFGRPDLTPNLVAEYLTPWEIGAAQARYVARFRDLMEDSSVVRRVRDSEPRPVYAQIDLSRLKLDRQLRSKILLLRRAIRDRKQVTGIEKGFPREFCPYTLGTKDGEWRVFSWQFGGRSSKPIGNGVWRCFRLEKLVDPKPRDGEWQHGEYTGQHASNSCISEIDTDIALKPKLLG
jgi:5'-deoxynucleotidase YfbR-like HD superfamily hydrolase